MIADLLHFAILAGLFLALGSVLLNLCFFKGLKAVVPPRDGPLVSILVPARNEALNIEKCVRSLLRQDWPKLEIIVLDDRSEDGTGDLVRRFQDDRLRVIMGADLPSGWVGKNWACDQLSSSARGEWLFFTDADTEHNLGVVSAAVTHARRVNADLLSAWPKLVTVSVGEQLVIPLIVFVAMIFHPHALITVLQRFPTLASRIPAEWLRPLGAANGQFLLFQRSSYDRIGGHAGQCNHLVEDVAFGRAVAARMGEGMRLINCESIQFSSCRMYRSLRETWEGFTKNSRAAFEENHIAFFAAGATVFFLFFWPFVALFLPGSPKFWMLIAIAINLGIRAILAWRFQTSWLSVVLHPFGIALTIAIAANSWIRSTRGGVEWKGRRYFLGGESGQS